MSWRTLRHTFRFRLSLWNTGVLAAALAGFGAAVCHSVQSDAAAAIDRELVTRVDPFASSEFSLPRPARRAGNDAAKLRQKPEKQSLPRELQATGSPAGTPGSGWSVINARIAAVNDEARRLIYFHRPRVLGTDGRGVGRFPYDTPWDPESFRRSLTGETRYSTVDAFQIPIRVLSVPLYSEEGSGATTPGSAGVARKVVGVVQVAHEVSELERLRAGLLRKLLILVPLALVVAGGGGLFLTGCALRPVAAVTRAAAEISSRDLSRRLKVRGQDELAELAATFNGMLARLEGAFAHLEAANEQLRRFTADVSHELRTPLTRLKGSLCLARQGNCPGGAPVATLDLAEHTVDDMHRLVLDLLHLARCDAGEQRVVSRPLDLRELLLDLAVTLPEKEGVEVVVDTPDRLRLWGDSFQLTRLFSNLLENAQRHTPAGGTITVTARPAGDRITVTVTDTGEGIAPEHLPHLFERFYRVDTARDRHRGGSGLGLAIARTIAEAHGGSISLQSQFGRGTEVRVVLSREPAQERMGGLWC